MSNINKLNQESEQGPQIVPKIASTACLAAITAGILFCLGLFISPSSVVFAASASSVSASSTSEDFFNQRYRGWLWFEEKERLQELQELQELQKQKLQRKNELAKAKAEVEQFAKELDELKFMMIRHPENIEHVLAYKKKESQMFNNAIKLDHSYRMANFVDPDHVDHLSNPANLYGRRIKEAQDRKADVQKIQGLASEVELFLFFVSTCPYCQQLEPVLNDFANKYGFKVEAVSLDGSQSKYFKTHDNQVNNLAAILGLKATPSIVMVTNDSAISFEFIRGAVSTTELEERSLLALKHLENLRASMPADKALPMPSNSNHSNQSNQLKETK